MLRYATLAVAATLIVSPAEAISRYTSTAMSCAEVQARIAAEGAAIMRYQSRNNPNLPRYDRYVSHESLCPVGHIGARASIPTADREACPVMRCKPEMKERLFRRPWLHSN
ncbi:MAG: hypothetical protein CMH69_20060 [Nitratireductor sp.]|uniref:hypothetical protein n=1 Tax=Nitratireductor sp. B36 TaxID=2762059 RepID=UPI000C898BE6|nr:hypothetical protein [Nitratireductor sp. B36]MAS15574.1 hypothetical protein [Nitratireductor sp.]MCC5777812.1 hypothetical protein [Nitratireductor sp. B36]